MAYRKKGVAFWTREEMMKKRQHSTDEDGSPLVVFPNDSEMAMAIQNKNLCMFCRNWDLELGQKEIHGQKFWQRIFREERWRKEWFEDPHGYGLCKVFEGRLRPGIAPATCIKSDFDESLYNKPGAMDQIPCPYYQDRRMLGSSMFIGAHSRSKLKH